MPICCTVTTSTHFPCLTRVSTLVQFSRSVMSDSLWPHGLQHARSPCPSPTPRVYSNSCPLNWWCYPIISSSVVPLSSHLQSFPASGSFQLSQFFTSGGQSIGVSASTSVLPMNIQDWSPLGWTGWISLQESKGLSGVFSNTTVQKRQLFSISEHSKKIWSYMIFFPLLSQRWRQSSKKFGVLRSLVCWRGYDLFKRVWIDELCKRELCQMQI